MKRIQRPKEITYEKPVALYLEEIEAIYHLLEETGGKVSLRTDLYEFESLAELEEYKRNTVKELTLSSFNLEGHIWVSITSSWVFLHSSGTSDYVGLLSRIEDVLESAVRDDLLARLIGSMRAVAVMSGILGLLIGTLLITAVNFIPPLSDFVASYTLTAVAVNIALSVAVSVYVVMRLLRRRNRIRLIPSRSQEEPTFYARNRDKIIVAVVVFILTALLSRVYDILTGP